eukprot:jgi/Mesvir1/2336/Mv25829-RA.2
MATNARKGKAAFHSLSMHGAAGALPPPEGKPAAAPPKLPVIPPLCMSALGTGPRNEGLASLRQTIISSNRTADTLDCRDASQITARLSDLTVQANKRAEYLLAAMEPPPTKRASTAPSAFRESVSDKSRSETKALEQLLSEIEGTLARGNASASARTAPTLSPPSTRPAKPKEVAKSRRIVAGSNRSRPARTLMAEMRVEEKLQLLRSDPLLLEQLHKSVAATRRDQTQERRRHSHDFVEENAHALELLTPHQLEEVSARVVARGRGPALSLALPHAAPQPPPPGAPHVPSSLHADGSRTERTPRGARVRPRVAADGGGSGGSPWTIDIDEESGASGCSQRAQTARAHVLRQDPDSGAVPSMAAGAETRTLSRPSRPAMTPVPDAGSGDDEDEGDAQATSDDDVLARTQRWADVARRRGVHWHHKGAVPLLEVRREQRRRHRADVRDMHQMLLDEHLQVWWRSTVICWQAQRLLLLMQWEAFEDARMKEAAMAQASTLPAPPPALAPHRRSEHAEAIIRVLRHKARLVQLAIAGVRPTRQDSNREVSGVEAQGGKGGAQTAGKGVSFEPDEEEATALTVGQVLNSKLAKEKASPRPHAPTVRFVRSNQTAPIDKRRPYVPRAGGTSHRARKVKTVPLDIKVKKIKEIWRVQFRKLIADRDTHAKQMALYAARLSMVSASTWVTSGQGGGHGGGHGGEGERSMLNPVLPLAPLRPRIRMLLSPEQMAELHEEGLNEAQERFERVEQARAQKLLE